MPQAKGESPLWVLSLEVSIPNLGKKATITRNVKSPKAPTITPDDPAIRADLVARFALSQSIYQTDPWADHAARPVEWSPVADLRLRAAE